MIFKPFYNFETGCASYFLGCAGKGVCAIVDPLYQHIEHYREFAETKKLRVRYVIDTHIHADHRSGGVELARLTGAEYCLHESADLATAFRPLLDGEEIALGNVALKILHTPGHTPDSICILVTDSRRSERPWFMLTGDTLFSGAVGRPDLPGEVRRRAQELFSSLHDKILAYPDELELFPGHFSGSVCGAGLSGKPSTTVGFEKAANPLLSLPKTDFIEQLTGLDLQRPAGMDEIVRLNRGAA